MEQKENVAQEVMRERVWALLSHKDFGPCHPLLHQTYNVLRGKHRSIFQCSCGLKFQLGDVDEREDEEGEDGEEYQGENDVNEKEKKRARVSANNEEGTEENEKTERCFESRTLRSLCLVVVVSYIDHWIQTNLLLAMDRADEDDGNHDVDEIEQDKIRNKVASFQRGVQRLNNQVNAFLLQCFQQQPDLQRNPTSSFAPTWLYLLPTELLQDMITLPPSSSNQSNHAQHPPQPFGSWKALYHDRALAKLLEGVSQGVTFGYSGTESYRSWMANPCTPLSSSSPSCCWKLVEVKEEAKAQAEQQYIAGPGMMQALCFSSKAVHSPSWQKLLQAGYNCYDSDSCGAFSCKPTVDGICCGPEQAERAGLLLRTMEENLLFVTFVEVEWKAEWDLFLVGVSPLSGRIVGLRTRV
ncbi:hypothetical protein QOT17_000862 [Balamuthia mandrillaris]